MSQNGDHSHSDDPKMAAAPKKPNAMDVHVGSRLRLRRMMLGYSQEKLGELLELTFQQIQKYERGINRVSASRLHDLARVLHVPVQYFYDDAPNVDGPRLIPGFGESQPETQITEFLASREGLDLNRAFLSIKDPKVRRSIVDLVRSLALEQKTSDIG